uniref:PID domain-containing protein n=1 Tax=Panagrellus redivivus TaxID=6233 RepID=A0A7E4ZY60_PANRE
MATTTLLQRDVFSCENLAAQLEATDAEKRGESSTPSAPLPPPTCLPSTSTSTSVTNGTPAALSNKNATTFDQISYLGCSKISNPLSESEMLQIVANFNAEKAHGAIPIRMVIPNFAGGTVRLCEEATNVEISSFAIQRIRFCARGQVNSAERACFALSFTQFTGVEELNQCHVFRCHVPETAGRALLCFANAFRNTDPNVVPSMPSTPSAPNLAGAARIGNATPAPMGIEEEYQFEAFLELKEEDAKKGFMLCPVERNCFKLRRDRERRVVVVIRQVSGPRPLAVKKCFGLLLAPGRNLREADMHLLDIESDTPGEGNRTYMIEGLWHPTAQNFEVLNTETPKETRVYLTVAADVILEGINEPVRFNIECKARVFQQYERFWYITRKAVNESYFLTIKMDESPSTSAEAPYKVVRCESVTERERTIATRASVGTLRSPTKLPSQLLHLADENDSDGDEPLLSGSGSVNRECPESVLTEWTALVDKWVEDQHSRPPKVNELIYDGVPDVLRGKVWQLLAKVYKEDDLANTYRMLLDKECPSEPVILRDIHRTFPAHEFFKETNGIGQESLYKISKAYSVYDEEVNYCQGLSFLAAALLLHMPEEQAFCVLVKIMFDYGLRDLFKLGFDALHLRFYQLERLMQDYNHELHNHFVQIGIETHMYASQWFLTLFTAKFPLQMVFFIVDLFLAEGVNTIFHISLALLQDSKKELLQLDFEGVLKYFRVALPRRYRTESNAKDLIHNAVKLKISHKKLLQYEKDYHSLKQRELESQDPLERLEKENIRLHETIRRLEHENDDLAHELVTSKIELRNKLDSTEDQLESALASIEHKTKDLLELEEQGKILREENDMVKDRCRREMTRLEAEVSRSKTLSNDYKKIVSDHSKRIDELQRRYVEEKKMVSARINNCETCTASLSDWLVESPRKSPNGLDSPDSNGSNGAGPLTVMDMMCKLEEKQQEIHQIEMELAETKLALVQALCHNQEISHQMTASTSSESGGKPAWFKKTISSIREVGTSLKGSQAVINGHSPITTGD